ncbi:unnamed protein product [Brassica rapa subsp. narinosa]
MDQIKPNQEIYMFFFNSVLLYDLMMSVMMNIKCYFTYRYEIYGNLESIIFYMS